MTTLTITHSHAEGTLIEGTSRGDGSADALKANRWRWSRNLGAWYIPGSRDHDARTWQVDSTAAALREAGFAVEVEIDNEARPTAEVQADKTARAAERAAALDAKAQRLHAAADGHRATVDQISENIPFGQPILVGHHSEGRARRDAAKIHANMGKAVEATAAAQEAERRADAARVNTRPEHPATTANRIDRLSAELRKLERQQGHSPIVDSPRMATLREQITYWEAVRAQQIADGLVIDTSTVKPGDYVEIHGSSWWRVTRANAKTLTLESGWSHIRRPRHQVTGHRPATN